MSNVYECEIVFFWVLKLPLKSLFSSDTYYAIKDPQFNLQFGRVLCVSLFYWSDMLWRMGQEWANPQWECDTLSWHDSLADGWHVERERERRNV